MAVFKAPKRRVDRVFLHCSATDIPMRGEALLNVVKNWHVRDRGWSDVGYHYLIDKEGSVLYGRDLEKAPAAQRGHNTGTIAIMLHGLYDFPEVQLKALRQLCRQINLAYSGIVAFKGHCEVSSKACPVFDYKRVLQLDNYGRMS